MIRRTSLAALLVLFAAGACSQAPTDTGVRADAPVARDSVVVDNPPPADTTRDTGGGTLGSGT
ncbi:hypothetical protein [Longimicrobium terrae]|uniref:Uncharacterized protein n=1 Tax=Longimicrobium terrae TaxID=1639882 RepID=A0A841H0B3_9BACT|nr:hypothetical protein [Longimicrobium terrae]MBB4636950.1 hypothetical protein [Longimicrobium terrae]MBB6071442.1 hypothetical protein [Longimicrobium terrae]NNC31339.1 hypothetical protein [Longimicrobium terrae]